MRVRLKYGNQRSSITVSSENLEERLTIRHFIDTVASTFGTDRNDVHVSLNGRDYYGQERQDMSADEWGVVPGDLIYVMTSSEIDDMRSDQGQSSRSDLSSEAGPSAVLDPMSLTLPVACHQMMNDFSSRSPLHCIALAVYTLLQDEESFEVSNDESTIEGILSGEGSIVRLSAIHKCNWKQDQIDGIAITLLTHGQFVSAGGQVVFHNGDVCSFTCAVPLYKFVNYDQDTRRYTFQDETDLAILLRDGLLLKFRQEINAYYQLPPLGIQRLPTELQVRLLSLLDARTVCRMECTCSFYRDLSRQGSLWEQLYAREFAKEYQVIQKSAENCSDRNWKLTYRQAYEMKKQLELQRYRLLHTIPYNVTRVTWNGQHPHPHPMQPPGMIGGPSDLRPAFPARLPHHW